jgi:putative mycofactocin binding protein MftB
MKNGALYCLNEGVQVRDEKFGLLFYNYRGPRMYFVPTRELIAADTFVRGITLGAVIESIKERQGWPEPWIASWASRLFETLQEKDLIHEQSIC